MQGYATIGALYLLTYSEKRLLWVVTENNSNDKTTTITVVSDCNEKGLKVKVDAKWLYEQEPVGPVFQPSGEVVIENGIEYIKIPKEEKGKTK